MNLKININTIKTISCQEFDRVVQEVYKRPYAFQQQDGCKSRGHEPISVSKDTEDFFDFQNDTIPEVVNGGERGVSFKAWLARDPKQPLRDQKTIITHQFSIDLWWKRNFYPSVEMIINDLCKRDILEPGEYWIIIDW
jgi:hypothetical protein